MQSSTDAILTYFKEINEQNTTERHKGRRERPERHTCFWLEKIQHQKDLNSLELQSTKNCCLFFLELDKLILKFIQKNEQK